MTKTYRGHKRAKHIDVRHHFMKEKIEKGEFTPVYIPSEDNVADLLTKTTSKRDHEEICERSGSLWPRGHGGVCGCKRISD